MLKKIINMVFILLIMAFLLAGFLRAFVFPKDINQYENRYAHKPDALSVAGYADGSFQSSVESSLSDQAPFAESMKMLYNRTNSSYIKELLALFPKKETPKYIKVGDMNLFSDDYILYNPTVFEYAKLLLDPQIEGLRNMLERHEDTEFYLFYIEKDTDINFETGEKCGIFEYLRDNLPIDEENTAKFSVDDFSEFSRCFYRTDHHWNHVGAYRGYTELMKLLCPEDELVPKGEEVLVKGKYSGSKAVGDLAAYSEDFLAYRYELPPMEVVSNREPVLGYGDAESYLSGEKENATYGLFYGGDMGELVFDTGREEAENILILGESYDNAILNLVATHFEKTYSVDLRFYEAYLGEKFSLGEYLDEHDVDKVLLIGNVDYFINKEFIPEN